jgi:hypothetical protein
MAGTDLQMLGAASTPGISCDPHHAMTGNSYTLRDAKGRILRFCRRYSRRARTLAPDR